MLSAPLPHHCACPGVVCQCTWVLALGAGWLGGSSAAGRVWGTAVAVGGEGVSAGGVPRTIVSAVEWGLRQCVLLLLVPCIRCGMRRSGR